MNEENNSGIALTQPVGSEKCEKRSLPKRYEAIESTVKRVRLPEGSENREILSLLDVKIELRASRQARRPHSSTPERGDKLYELTGLAGTTGFAGVLDGEAGREFKNVDLKLLTGSRSLGSYAPQ